MKPKQSWFNIQRNAISNTTADVYVYDEIGIWGITAKEFATELNALTAVETIHLHVNSPGGSVVEVLAMMQALKQHPGKVIAYVDGLAASSASRLILAADEILIAENAFVMIHNVWSMVMGNAAEIRKEADVLDKFDAGLVNDYAKRTGKEPAEIEALMAADTWFTAAEAVEFGLADATIAEQKAAACVSENFFNRLGDFRNLPEDLDFEVVFEEAAPPAPEEPEPISNVTPLAVYQRRVALLETEITI